MALQEFAKKPPAEVINKALIYVQAWNSAANKAIRDRDPALAKRLVETANHILGQVAEASLRRGLTPAQQDELDQLVIRVSRIINLRFETLDKIRLLDPKSNPELQSNVERKLRTMTLFGALTELETAGELVGGDRDLSFRNVIADKVKELVDNAPPAAWTAVEKRSFIDLITKAVEPLMEFGVLQPATIDTRNVTLHFEKLIENLRKSSGGSSALMFNAEFNSNFLVNSSNIDDEQFSPGMGVVQGICCVAYYLMKTKDSPGDGIYRAFDRTGEYSGEQVKAMIEFICTHPAFTIVDEAGINHTINIRAAIGRFPPDVQSVIKYVASLKMARDDLGQKASNYIQIKDGKSPKLLGTGSCADKWVNGYISRTIYKAAQTANNKEHMVVLGWLDPSAIPELGFNHATGAPLATDARAQEVARKMTLMDAAGEWYRPNHYAINARAALHCRPTKWDQDFPAPDEYCNRVDNKSPISYRDAKDAWEYIIQQSYQTTLMKVPSEHTEMKRTIEGFLSELFTKTAILMGYIGPGIPDGINDEYIPFHLMPKAALKFILMNIIFAVPGRISAKDEQFYFRFSSFGSRNPNGEVYERRRQAISIISEQIRKYPSLGNVGVAGSYASELDIFIQNPWLVSEDYVDPLSRRIRFNDVRLKNTTSLVGISEKEKGKQLTMDFALPFDPVKDSHKD